MRLYVAMIFVFSGISLSFAMDTELKLYRPFGETSGQAPLVVKKIYQGECLGQSQRIKREDAWTCRVDNKRYDPCFIKPSGSHLQAICPQSPWTGNSIAIYLAHEADARAQIPLDMSQTYPWAIELSNGVRCQALDEGSTVDGLPLRYQCNNQHQLLGHLQRCKMPWAILQRNKQGQTSTVAVTKAWF